MAIGLNVIVLLTIALFAAAPFLVHTFWVKKDNMPPAVKTVLQWSLDHFISLSLLLLILSGSLFLLAKDRGNWPKVLVGLLACVAIVLYQTDNLGFVPGNQTLDQNAQAVHDRAKSAMKTEPWVMYLVAALFLLASLYLIRKIYLRPEVFGKTFGGADDEDYEEQYEQDEDSEQDEDDEEAPIEYGDMDLEESYGGDATEVADGMDSEYEERALLDTVSDANASMEYIRTMGE